MPFNDELNARLITQVVDFTDVVALAHPEAHGFKVASMDNKHGIKMLTKPVEESPVHLMKAESLMPCPPAEFLRYLDTEIRAMWDENIHSSQVIRNLDVVSKKDSLLSSSSSSLTKEKGTNRSRNNNGTMITSTLLKHMEFKSPLPQFFRNRDFEIVVHEQLDKQSGVGLLKAFSTPREYLKPVVRDDGPNGRGATTRAGQAVAASVGRWLGMGSGGGSCKSNTAASSSSEGLNDETSPSSGGGEINTEAVVRGSIVMSGFVVVPLLLLDDGTVVEDRRGLSESEHEGGVRALGTLPPTFQALLKHRQKSRADAGLDPVEFMTLPTIRGGATSSSSSSLPKTTQYRVIGSKVVYIALVQPMGRIPPMLVNLVIGKQTSGLKYLQKFIAKNPLSTLPQSKDGSSSGSGGGVRSASKL